MTSSRSFSAQSCRGAAERQRPPSTRARHPRPVPSRAEGTAPGRARTRRSPRSRRRPLAPRPSTREAPDDRPVPTATGPGPAPARPGGWSGVGPGRDGVPGRGAGGGPDPGRGRPLRRPLPASGGRARRRLRGRARPAAARARHDRPALMVRRSRLDAELVRRGLARSREHAVALIAEGRVAVSGRPATKPATGVDANTPVVVRTDPDEPTWVSRGAHKLLGALEAFPVPVEGRRALDAGASTGGFTDVLLRRGVAEVVAVDVGYGELAWSLRTDERVVVHERTNVRSLTPEAIGGPADLVVADLSFISLRLVLPALTACAGEDADLLPMVKPQFEVGRDRLGAGGVVRDPEHRIAAVLDVARSAAGLGWGTAGVVASPLPGPAGNVEFFLWLRRDAGLPGEDDVRRAVREGPQ